MGKSPGFYQRHPTFTAIFIWTNLIVGTLGFIIGSIGMIVALVQLW